MSAAIGSALAGARTITATSSQGLALMAEVVYIAAAMRAPIVMAVGNRALSGADQHPLRPLRLDARSATPGAIQLFAENAQEAYDLMVIAPRLAEHPDVLLPVLVCQDGFTITHSAEPVALLDDERRARLRRRLPDPVSRCSTSRTRRSQGPFAMPDYYFELRHQQRRARWRRRSPCSTTWRPSSRELVGPAATAPSSATALDGRGARRSSASARRPAPSRTSSTSCAPRASAVGLLQIRSFRPFPVARDRARRSPTCRRVSVLDRADSPGGAPPLFAGGRRRALRRRRGARGATSTASAAATSTRRTSATSSPGDRRAEYLGLRGAPCPA